MSKKYFKILIIVILSAILITVFFQKGSQKGPKALSPNNVKVSLVILDKRYEMEIKDGSTVFETMNKIQDESNNTNPFSFKSKEVSGLGIFVNEINGLKGGGDGYWIYYVNGLEASVGVSNYKIKNGDIISWKYEK